MIPLNINGKSTSGDARFLINESTALLGSTYLQAFHSPLGLHWSFSD
jgi:hypothetical protein